MLASSGISVVDIKWYVNGNLSTLLDAAIGESIVSFTIFK